MAKISIGGDEDAAGSISSPTRKRLCVIRLPRSPINYYSHKPQDQKEEQNEEVDYDEEEEEEEVDCDGGEEEEEEIASSNIILTDSEVLDCPICFDNLTIPVYQCENGHVACSLCSSKVRNKCPSCSLPIGYNRCRAMERVLSTVRVKCENEHYGCKVKVSYASRKDHTRTCMYSPCSCPSPGCTVVSSSNELYQHFRRKHIADAVCFYYNYTFTVALHKEKIIILREHKDGVLFILYNETKLFGNMVTLSCIWPTSFTGFCCDIVARNEVTSLQFQSSIEGSPTLIDDPSPKRFVIIPSGFFNNDRPTLNICIRHQPIKVESL